MKLCVYNIEYKIEGRVTNIHVFGRDKKGNRVHYTEIFKPYFYIPSGEDISRTRRIVAYEDGYTSLFGDKMKKVYTMYPGHVRNVRDLFRSPHEADIPFALRYQIDKQIFSGLNTDTRRGADVSVVPRINYLDIETEGSLDTTRAPAPVICVTSYDSYLKNYNTFTWGGNRENQRTKCTGVDGGIFTHIIHNYVNEQQMINYFFKYIKETDPDILTGWNLQNFDIPYLIRRAENLRVDPNILSPLNRATFTDRARIAGRQIFDLCTGFKKLQRRDFPSWKLNDVAGKVLKIGKIELPDRIEKMWVDGRKSEIIEYNVRDVDLTRCLDEGERVISYYDTVRKIAGCPITSALYNSMALDAYLLHFCKDKFVLPSKIKRDEITYQGAFVDEPPIGLHENVIVMDVEQMYVHLIKTYNISPEVKIGYGNNVSFSKDKIGILPQLLTQLVTVRKEYKRKMAKYEIGTNQYKTYDNLQYAVKRLALSLYGVMGYTSFRLFDIDVAAAIARVGRELLGSYRNLIGELGYTPIYSDTDSIFLPAKGDKLSEIVAEGDKLKTYLNQHISRFVGEGHSFNMEFEKVYGKIFWKDAKKRYCGKFLWKEGKPYDGIDTVGFDTVRSDQAILSRNLQKAILKMVVEGCPEEDVREYVGKEIKRLKNGEIPVVELAITKGIKKKLNSYNPKPAQVRGALYANEYLGEHIQAGEKVKYLWVKDVPKDLPKTDVVSFLNPHAIDGFIPDTTRLIDGLIRKKISFVEQLGWDLERMIDVEQKKLYEFGV